MTEARVPASVVISLSAHVAALAAFGFLVHSAPKAVIQQVTSVDIMTPAPKAAAPRPPRAKAPMPKNMNIFKMMTELPHAAAAPPPAVPILAPVIPPPEQHKVTMAEPPKLQEAKPKALPNLPTLNMDTSHPIAAAKIDVNMTPTHAVTALASLPVLADVGTRRASPKAIALEDARRQVVSQIGISDIATPPPSHRDALAAMAVLQDASTHRAAAGGGGIPDFGLAAPGGGLHDAQPARVAAPVVAPTIAPAPKPVARAPVAMPTETKKSLEIEGPLSGRTVISRVIPPFPAWAKDQGILEADVLIRFTVDEEGSVTPGGMTIQASSSYGRIDKLAMDALQNWRFEPKPGAGSQWGIITFKFVLE